ncbi:transporter substrate-binding domain-containing protein [Pseudomonas sp. 21LCFQ010]|uniref:substrate-binding periplasmic protein n=1 Tax=Pseudomonas sp. 21LCFQ010 TaxID=2957506 RepID=UPI0020976C01|nr:transporter substrate-binding domain-containing protein [Pseudomonas sp. 21LCFQ010]MCO8163165.1 transporter substrate-binding domain-containing protein [Pseudomonas sp. 21LCFQ010]
MHLSTNSLRYTGLRALKRFCAALMVGVLYPWQTLLAAPADIYLLEAPPLTMSGPVGRSGILGDVSQKAAALAGYELNVRSMPWNRAQRTVQMGENLLIIPLSRIPSRENSYTWIVPIMTMERAFFSLDKRVENFDEARRSYRRIAVGLGSAQEQMLREQGFADEQIYPLKIGENPAQMLLLGRVDAWFNGVPETRYIWRDVSSRPLLMSPPMMPTDLYLACSKTCAEPMVQRLKKAVERLRDDGSIERIIDSYLHDLPGPQASRLP